MAGELAVDGGWMRGVVIVRRVRVAGRVANSPGQAKVADLQVAASGDEDIGRLQVTVNDTRRVDVSGGSPSSQKAGGGGDGGGGGEQGRWGYQINHKGRKQHETGKRT